MKTDARILHTEKLLKDAFFELCEEKPLNKITPTELCRRANINRNTFYSHYDNIDAFINTLEEDVISFLRVSIQDDFNPVTVIAMLCKYMKKNKAFYHAILSPNGDPTFLPRIFEVASQRNMKKIEKETRCLSPNMANIICDFSVKGGCAVIETWFHNGMQESPEEIADLIDQLCHYGTRSFLKKYN